MVADHLNSGGFHMLGTGRDKIDTPQKMKQCRETCAAFKLSGLAVVGGDDSNTNAPFLAGKNSSGIGTQAHRQTPQDHRRVISRCGGCSRFPGLQLRLHGLCPPEGGTSSTRDCKSDLNTGISTADGL